MSLIQRAKAWWNRPSRRELADECEQLRIQLAGCGVAALGYARGENVVRPGSYGHSASLDDVNRLYENYRTLRNAIDQIANDSAPGDCAHDMADTYVEWARLARRTIWKRSGLLHILEPEQARTDQ